MSFCLTGTRTCVHIRNSGIASPKREPAYPKKLIISQTVHILQLDSTVHIHGCVVEPIHPYSPIDLAHLSCRYTSVFIEARQIMVGSPLLVMVGHSSTYHSTEGVHPAGMVPALLRNMIALLFNIIFLFLMEEPPFSHHHYCRPSSPCHDHAIDLPLQVLPWLVFSSSS